MATPIDFNRQSRFVWLILVVLGAILCVVGWARWAGAQQVEPSGADAAGWAGRSGRESTYPTYLTHLTNLAEAADDVAGRFTTVIVI